MRDDPRATAVNSEPQCLSSPSSLSCPNVTQDTTNPQCRSKGNISGGARERRRREPLEGSGGMLPQKILKSRGLEMPFPAFSKSYL